jgi:LmbE family N-acetylglucosaminyl deacetylase
VLISSASSSSSSKSVCVFAAHPDDEVLGCGGTIAKHVERGDIVNVIIFAEGIFSRSNPSSEDPPSSVAVEKLDMLRKSAVAANQILGVHNLQFLSFPDNRMDSIDRLDIIKAVELYVEEHKPDRIYTHHSSDLNVDHRRLHESVVTATRPIPNSIKPSILSFEVASSTEWQSPTIGHAFQPNFFSDISSTLEKKTAALGEYLCEMRDWPHARSVQAVQHQAHYRGSQIGTNSAEAFVLLRHIE